MDDEFRPPDALPDEEPTASTSNQKAEVLPDGGYGWVCVACCFLINAHTWGINSSYGVFLAFYLDNDYYPGAGPLDFAFVGGLSISMALLVSPIATSTTRLFGTRVTLLIGVCLETLALIGASFTHRIWQLLLSQGLCFGFGMGFLFVGSVGVVPQWFTKKRSLANGIGTAGSGIGGLIYSLATNAMIQSLGVGWAFRILGILAFTVNSACALLMKDRNKAIGSSQLAFDHRLFKRKEFLLILGWGFFSMLGYIVLLFSLPNYALSVSILLLRRSIHAKSFYSTANIIRNNSNVFDFFLFRHCKVYTLTQPTDRPQRISRFCCRCVAQSGPRSRKAVYRNFQRHCWAH